MSSGEDLAQYNIDVTQADGEEDKEEDGRTGLDEAGPSPA